MKIKEGSRRLGGQRVNRPSSNGKTSVVVPRKDMALYFFGSPRVAATLSACVSAPTSGGDVLHSATHASQVPLKYKPSASQDRPSAPNLPPRSDGHGRSCAHRWRLRRPQGRSTR